MFRHSIEDRLSKIFVADRSSFTDPVQTVETIFACNLHRSRRLRHLYNFILFLINSALQSFNCNAPAFRSPRIYTDQQPSAGTTREREVHRFNFREHEIDMRSALYYTVVCGIILAQ